MMRKINERGLRILKDFEALSLESYEDEGGVWTIGWGHTGPEVIKGQEITEGEAEALLMLDLHIAEQTISHLVQVNISDNQFSALVVFSFNIGVNAFRRSTMLKIINSGGYENVIKAADQFDRWVYVKRKISRGLIRRRAAEKELYLSTQE